VKNIIAALALFGLLADLCAATTIDTVNRYAWGANLGWMDWTGGAGDTANGAVLGEYVCSGYIYSANVSRQRCAREPDSTAVYPTIMGKPAKNVKTPRGWVRVGH
jgi:hypothetical protein